jgi:hypothetical protein
MRWAVFMIVMSACSRADSPAPIEKPSPSASAPASSGKEEATTLMNAAVPFAEKMLKEHGEFFPYASAIASDGAITMVAAKLDTEQPAAAVVVKKLEEALRTGAMARSGGRPPPKLRLGERKRLAVDADAVVRAQRETKDLLHGRVGDDLARPAIRFERALERDVVRQHPRLEGDGLAVDELDRVPLELAHVAVPHDPMRPKIHAQSRGCTGRSGWSTPSFACVSPVT